MCPHCKQDKIKIGKRHWPDGKFDYWCPSCGRQVPEPDAVKALESVEPAAGEVVLYDRMVLAINQCHETDEVKQIRDQALALQHCARIAKNVEAERKAAEIRIRAERRTGELLKELEKSKGGRPPENSLHDANSLFSQAKEDAGISDNQAARWQQLADIPKEQFEEALSDPDTKPSTSGLIKEEKKPPSFLKPIMDLPPPKKLDANPRRCTASCCPEGSDIAGPWARHDAQALLDQRGFPYGHFGDDHDAVLDFGVECDQRHLLAELGGLGRSAIEIRQRGHNYRGI